MPKEIKKPTKADKAAKTTASSKTNTPKPDKKVTPEKAAPTKAAFKLDATAQRIIDTFAEISAIPRESGNEEQIRQYLINWARSNKFLYINIFIFSLCMFTTKLNFYLWKLIITYCNKF